VRRAGVTIAFALAAAGCGGQAHGVVATGPPPPSTATLCGALPAGLHATPVWLRTSDGVRLYAAAAGSGPTAVVLAHQSPANLCGWLPTMRYLSSRGIATLAFNFRTFAPSGSPRAAISRHLAPDLQAAIDAAHARGAQRVFVMGASFGGAATLAYGAQLRDLAGVINLSGELRLLNWNLDGIDAVRRLKAPLLVLASRYDGYLDAADARLLYRRAGSTKKRLVIFPGGFHGWAILDEAPYAAQARALILAWLRG
jgi:alpha-beta hydrolase superfamily lysophospholipase